LKLESNSAGVNTDGSRQVHGRFDSAVLESVDEGLLVLGETVRYVILYCIQTTYQIKREEIPSKLQMFREALQSNFGAGADAIEKHIAKTLYGKLNLKFEEHEGWTMVDYVKDAKSKAGAEI